MAESERISQQKNEPEKEFKKDEVTSEQEKTASQKNAEASFSEFVKFLEGKSGELFNLPEETLLFGTSVLGNSLINEYLGGGGPVAALTGNPSLFMEPDDNVNHIKTSPPGLIGTETAGNCAIVGRKGEPLVPVPVNVMDRYEVNNG